MKSIISTLPGFILVFLSDPAAAAESADQIYVYATKRAQPLSEIPGSVSVIDGAGAAKANAFSSGEEIAQLMSGVQSAVANGTQVAFQIRGIGAVDHQALTPTAAAVYLDGVFLSTNVQTGPLLYDLERIEVLKGPQGTLYGRNASSGAVNLITVRPGGEQTNYLSISGGKFDRIDLSAAAGGDIADSVSLRIAARRLSQGPALANVDSNPAAPNGPERAGGERDEWGVRTSLNWKAGETLNLLVRGHYEEDNGVNPSPRNSSLSLGRHQISIGPDGVQDSDNEFYGASLEANGAAGGWNIFSLTAIEGYNQDYGFDFDGTEAPFGNPNLNANLHYDRDFTQISEELRFDRDWRHGHAMIGVTAARETFEQTYTIWCGYLDPATLIGTCPYVGAAGRVGPAPASPAQARTLVTDIAQDRNTAALFASNDLNLGSRLTLTLGARYTFEEIEGEGSGRHIFSDGVIAFNNRDGIGAAIGSNRIEENRVSGNAALVWRPNGTASFYASFSNGYKSGGFNGEVQNNAAHFADEGLFRAETVNAFEAGYRGQPAPSLRLSGALFYQDYRRPQARIFVAFPLPGGGVITSNSLSNLDSAKSYGFEGEAKWAPVEGLDLGASLTLLETEIDQTTNIGGNAALFDGNPLPFASKVSATLSGRYERRLSEAFAASLAANAKYQSAFYLDAEGLAARRQEGYTIVDAELAFIHSPSEFELAFSARNLLNKEYAVSGFGFIGYNKFLGEPRTFSVRATKRF